ncbi:heavy metal transporter [Blautia sp. An249]|uniref:heavy-metal-associated domain-containing protein n=1 Tax=Blautia sp. An249 TaxID=1965603 RepID=UPI000B3996AA|nr:heavy metal-associated domain-containing protein [Blautia sp. An249]OUO76369.1 heavy metal transporter [Blautia sp. An249]
MKKTIKLIDLDCGHCADKIQRAVQKIDGVTHVEVNFLNQKMILEAPDDKFDSILAEAKLLIKKIEPDVTVKV